MVENTIETLDPSWISIETETVLHSNFYQGHKMVFGDISLSFTKKTKHLDIKVKAHESKLKYIKIRWPKKLPKESKILGDEWERSYGTMGFKPISPNQILPWYFLAKTSEETVGVGVKVQPNAMCFWQVDPAGITLVMDLRNGGNGVHLQGRQLRVAQVVSKIYHGDDSFSAAVSFCKRMCPEPLLPDVPVYGSNNWYYAYGDTSENDVLEDAKYLATLTKKCENPAFMVLDDGWQEEHRLLEYNGGPWKKGNNKFLDLKKMNQKIKSLGLRTGIWFRPLLNKDKVFTDECRISALTLDPTHPFVEEYLRQDIRRICEWGFELIKHDFSTYDLFGRWGFEMNPMVTKENWHFYDKTLTNAEIVKNFYRLIFEECHSSNTLILGCNTMGHLGAGLMHIHRTGDDTSGLEWERTRQIGVNTLAFRLPQHNTFYHVDADCVGITGQIDWRFNKQWTEVLARSGTPLFVSIKPNILSPTELLEMQDLMILASKQTQHMIPLDWELIDCPDTWGEDSETISYNWYQEDGVHFVVNPLRYQSFLSIE